MPLTREILQEIVNRSGLGLRGFAREFGGWDPGHLFRTLAGTKPIGPSALGRTLVRLKKVDPKAAAKLIETYLEEQRETIEAERRRFAQKSALKKGQGL
ncbi:MAG TPA: hypothetical protein VHD62_09620 [Opitutaceae bacterium]|nr:hypothetical protein [Opitutaceae bacterium]